MPKEYSPFTPGLPVPVEFFVGRIHEVEQVLESVRKSGDLKTVERIFVIGERGIGKSSLCSFARVVAEEKLNVLGLHVFLGGVSSLEEMARRIFERLLQDSRDKPWFEGVKSFLGNHVKEVGLFGISLKFEASKSDLSQAVSDFVPAMRNLLRRIGSQKKGFVLILDDLNGLASSEKFANWIKSIVDEIATSKESIPMTLILVGLPERRKQLVGNQPSLDRVFNLIKINRFSEEETKEFYGKAFERVNTTVSNEAHKMFWRFSGGFPVFMHEIGDATYQIDKDDYIDQKDATEGIIRATQVIGAKYIEPKVMSAIRSEKYRSILKRIVRGDFQPRFSRHEVLSRLSSPQKKVFDNFIRRMRDLDVVRAEPERGAGSYEFTSELYALFFWLQAAMGKNI